MKVSVNLERAIWLEFLSRCHDEDAKPGDVITAWLKRACRQDRTIMPTKEGHRPKILSIEGIRHGKE